MIPKLTHVLSLLIPFFMATATFAQELPTPQPSHFPKQPSAKKAQSHLKRGEYLKIKPMAPPSSLVLKVPPEVIPVPPWPTYFELTKLNGQLIIRYRAKDPNLHLSRQDAIVIELVTDFPFKVDPTIILTESWPKDSTQMTLKPSGAKPLSRNRILGKAAYTYCHQKTLVCTKALTTISYSYTP